MRDFLEFLNMADLEAIKALPGMNNSLAERIVAERPFASLDDALAVHGMGMKLLSRLEASFNEPAAAIELAAPVEPEPEPLLPTNPSRPAELAAVPPPAAPPPPPAKPSGPGFWSRLGRAFLNFLRFLFTLFIILAILAGIGAAIYWGLPYLNEKYVVPVEQNTAHISVLATQQQADVQALKARVDELQQQLDTANERMDSLDKTLAAQTETLAKLEQMQSTLDDAAARQRDSLLVELRHQVLLTRAIETLSRSRLYLSQSNFGMAKVDVQSTRDLVRELKADVPDFQAKALDAVLDRLDLALGNLPDYPVIAVDDVDIAWNLLIVGLPESAEAAEKLIPTPTVTLAPELTPTPTLEAPPQPTPTVTATP